MRSGNNILITGIPGCGKTTMIRHLAELLRDMNPVGFYTAEMRERGVRTGFELVSLDGKKGILSYVDFKGPKRVGKYGVDVEGFERFIDAIPFLRSKGSLIVIDEIGKMECLSRRFTDLVRSLLDVDRPVIATIALRGGGFIAEVKRRSDVVLHVLTPANRDSLLADIEEIVRA